LLGEGSSEYKALPAGQSLIQQQFYIFRILHFQTKSLFYSPPPSLRRSRPRIPHRPETRERPATRTMTVIVPLLSVSLGQQFKRTFVEAFTIRSRCLGSRIVIATLGLPPIALARRAREPSVPVRALSIKLIHCRDDDGPRQNLPGLPTSR